MKSVKVIDISAEVTTDRKRPSWFSKIFDGVTTIRHVDPAHILILTSQDLEADDLLIVAEGQIEGPLGPLSVLDQVLQGLQDSQNRLKKSLERYNGDYQLKLLLRSSTPVHFSSVSSPGPSPQSLRQKTSGGLWVLRKTGMGSNLGSLHWHSLNPQTSQFYCSTEHQCQKYYCP